MEAYQGKDGKEEKTAKEEEAKAPVIATEAVAKVAWGAKGQEDEGNFDQELQKKKEERKQALQSEAAKRKENKDEEKKKKRVMAAKTQVSTNLQASPCKPSTKRNSASPTSTSLVVT